MRPSTKSLEIQIKHLIKSSIFIQEEKTEIKKVQKEDLAKTASTEYEDINITIRDIGISQGKCMDFHPVEEEIDITQLQNEDLAKATSSEHGEVAFNYENHLTKSTHEDVKLVLRDLRISQGKCMNFHMCLKKLRDFLNSLIHFFFM